MTNRRKDQPVIKYEIAKKMARNAKVLASADNDAVSMKQFKLIVDCLMANDNATLAHALKITESNHAQAHMENEIFLTATRQTYAYSKTGEEYDVELMLIPVLLVVRTRERPRRIDLSLDTINPFMLNLPSAFQEPGVKLEVHPRFFDMDELGSLEYTDLFMLTRLLGSSELSMIKHPRPALLDSPPLTLELPPHSVSETLLFVMAGVTVPDDLDNPFDFEDEEIEDWLSEMSDYLSVTYGAEVEIKEPALFHYVFDHYGMLLQSSRAYAQIALAALARELAPADVRTLAALHRSKQYGMEIRVAAYANTDPEQLICAGYWQAQSQMELMVQVQHLKEMLGKMGMPEAVVVEDVVREAHCDCCGRRVFPTPTGTLVHADAVNFDGYHSEDAETGASAGAEFSMAAGSAAAGKD